MSLAIAVGGAIAGHSSMPAHVVAAVKIEKLEEGFAAQSVKIEEFGVIMTDVRIQQARIEPLLEAVQRQLDEHH